MNTEKQSEGQHKPRWQTGEVITCHIYDGETLMMTVWGGSNHQDNDKHAREIVALLNAAEEKGTI